MYRNMNADLSKAPHINVKRSIIPIKTGRSTTCNAGDIVPFFWTETLPGGTYSMDTSFVARLTPSVNPTMDTAFIDFYYFHVPFRVLWNDYKHFFGEPEDYWVATGTYSIPQIKFPEGGFSVGSLADHLGLPPGVQPAKDDGDTVSIMPILAYISCANEWFRSENLQSPWYCPKDTASLTGITGWQVGSAAELASPLEGPLHGASLIKACKPFDLYTGMLPAPQRAGAEVTIPIAATGDKLPVYTGADHFSPSDPGLPIYWANSSQSTGTAMAAGAATSYHILNTQEEAAKSGLVGMYDPIDVGYPSGQEPLYPTNLWTRVTRDVTATLNDMRYAFALQHLYEDLARHGARYRSILHGIFGVTDTDPTRDIPEYLGGGRCEINMSTVLNSAAVTAGQPLGSMAGYSHTSDSSKSYVFSARESGIIIGVFVIRQPKTYAQGVFNQWNRKDRFDFFWPSFSNIGEVSIPKSAVYLSNDGHNKEAMGYQEAWYDYRQIPYEVHGLFRPGVSGSLSSWNYADYYTSRPTLSDEWITDNSQANIDRTLAVPSTTSGCQFLVNIGLNATHVLPMPVYSIPGLTRL